MCLVYWSHHNSGHTALPWMLVKGKQSFKFTNGNPTKTWDWNFIFYFSWLIHSKCNIHQRCETCLLVVSALFPTFFILLFTYVGLNECRINVHNAFWLFVEIPMLPYRKTLCKEQKLCFYIHCCTDMCDWYAFIQVHVVKSSDLK